MIMRALCNRGVGGGVENAGISYNRAMRMVRVVSAVQKVSSVKMQSVSYTESWSSRVVVVIMSCRPEHPRCQPGLRLLGFFGLFLVSFSHVFCCVLFLRNSDTIHGLMHRDDLGA